MKENQKGFLLDIDHLVTKSKLLNKFVISVSTILFPQAEAIGCVATEPMYQGAWCYDGYCEGVPYHGSPCSIAHFYRPRYKQSDGSFCDGPCPSGPGDPAYITRSPCSGPCETKAGF